jgi:autotransporter-associated beta strand protein
VKTGGSNLIITGPNTYTGNTTVNGGTLDISSGGLAVGLGQSLSGTGNVAGLVTVSGGGSVAPGNATGVGTLTLTDLTLGTSSVQYTFNTGTLGLVSVTNPNAFIANGGSSSVTLNFLGLNPNPGTHTLIDYDGAALTNPQFSAFVQGALFSRIEAVLVNNTVNTSVDLNVLGIKFPIWTGSFSTEWSTGVIGGTKNWVLNGGGAQTDFIASDKVVFDTTAAAASPVVDISLADVTPSDILVDSTKDYTINGPFGIAGATPLVKTNTGKLTINSTNSFTGAVAINGGTVSVPTISDSGVAGTLGAGTTAIAIDNGTLEFTGVAGSTNRGITAGALGAAVSTPTGSTLTLAGVVGGAGALEKKDAGTVVLTGLANTIAAVNITAGTLQIGDGVAVGSLNTTVPAVIIPITNNGTLAFNTPAAGLAVPHTITGTGGLTVSGAGNVTLNGGAVANTFAGDTVVNSGGLVLSHTSATNSIGGNLIVNGGTVSYGATAGQLADHIPATASITVTGGTFGGTSGRAIDNPLTGLTETAGSLSISGGTFLSGRNDAGTFALSGAFNATGGTTILQRGGSITASSVVLGSGATISFDGGSTGFASRLFVGSGGITLSGATINLNVGPSAITAGSQGSLITLGGNVTVSASTTLNRINVVPANLVVPAGFDVNGGNREFNVAAGNALTLGTLAAPVGIVNTSIATPGGIIKSGGGNLVLNGANTYNGDTIIQDGTLTLTGTLSGSANIDVQSTKTFDVSGVVGGFTLGAAQILKGNGNVVGSTTIGGTLAPGASIGTLNFANDLIFGAGGIGLFEINKTGAIRTADLANVTGALTLAGTLNVTATGDSLIEGDSFNLFDAASFAGTMAAGTLPTLDVGLSWNTDNLGVDGTIVVVPEPGSVALLVMGTALLFRRRRQA